MFWVLGFAQKSFLFWVLALLGFVPSLVPRLRHGKETRKTETERKYGNPENGTEREYGNRNGNGKRVRKPEMESTETGNGEYGNRKRKRKKCYFMKKSRKNAIL